MESNPKFEIVNETGPVIRIVEDTPETETSLPEEPLKINPRYEYLGQYNVSDHPNYKPSPVFRDMKWLLAYDKQAAKYPKRFKPRAT